MDDRANVLEKALTNPFHENVSSSSCMSRLTLFYYLDAEREIIVLAFTEVKFLLMMCYCTDVILHNDMTEKIMFYII